jgi:hypothetical protein
VKVGPELVYSGFQSDGVVARLAGDSTGIEWCGYVGGSFTEVLVDVEVDGGGRAWFVGRTFTPDDDPVPPPLLNGPDDTYNGALDGFVGRVEADGTGFDFAGYVGGDGSDGLVALALRTGQELTTSAWVGGTTTSTEATLPISGGPDLTHNGGGEDVLLLLISATDGDPDPDPDPDPEDKVVTLELVGTKGKAKDTTKAGKDSFNYKGTLAFGGASPDGEFDPANDEMKILVGTGDAIFEHVVPAGGAGWKVTKKGLKWKGPIGAVKYKSKKGKFSLKLKKFDFPGAPTTPFGFTFILGDDCAQPEDEWVEQKPGTLKLVR